jgi:hypothetical protein
MFGAQDWRAVRAHQPDRQPVQRLRLQLLSFREVPNTHDEGRVSVGGQEFFAEPVDPGDGFHGRGMKG